MDSQTASNGHDNKIFMRKLHTKENTMDKFRQPGYIYILHAEETDRFKIGASSHPNKDCQFINTFSPFPVEIVARYPSLDMGLDEQKLQNTFRHRRVRHESNWFVFESVEHAKGLIDEFFNLATFERKTGEELVQTRMKLGVDVDLLAAQAVNLFIKENYNGEAISSRDCYRKSTLRTQFHLTAESTERIFDKLQSMNLGRKIVEGGDKNRRVKFLPIPEFPCFL